MEFPRVMLQPTHQYWGRAIACGGRGVPRKRRWMFAVSPCLLRIWTRSREQLSMQPLAMRHASCGCCSWAAKQINFFHSLPVPLSGNRQPYALTLRGGRDCVVDLCTTRCFLRCIILINDWSILDAYRGQVTFFQTNSKLNTLGSVGHDEERTTRDHVLNSPCFTLSDELRTLSRHGLLQASVTGYLHRWYQPMDQCVIES